MELLRVRSGRSGWAGPVSGGARETGDRAGDDGGAGRPVSSAASRIAAAGLLVAALLAAALFAAALLGWPAPAAAHHGFIGKHDFAHPLYLRGRIIAAQIGLPHARLTISVPDGLQLPRDRERMRALEDAEARQTMTILTLGDRRGAVDVRLDRRLTQRLIDEPELVRAGATVEVVVYRRTTSDEYRNELMVVLLLLPDGQVLVSSNPAVGRVPARDRARMPGPGPVPGQGHGQGQGQGSDRRLVH